MDSRRATWAVLVLAFIASCIVLAVVGTLLLPAGAALQGGAAPQPAGPLATVLTGLGVATVLAGLAIFHAKAGAHEREMQASSDRTAAGAFQTTTVIALALIESGPVFGLVIRLLTGSTTQLVALAGLGVLSIAGGVLPRGLSIWAAARMQSPPAP